RPSNGPITSIDARILLTKSYGAEMDNSSLASIYTLFFSNFTSAFNTLNKSTNVLQSDNSGTFEITDSPFEAKRDAANIGRTEFLAPSIFTLPLSLRPPLTIILSIFSLHIILNNLIL